MMRRVLPLALIVVATNLAMLASARSNRIGPPDTLEMTERELPRLDRSARDSAVKVILRYEHAVDWSRAREGRVLPGLGFVCQSPSGGSLGSCGPARRVFAALEYDGPAWQAVRAERIRQREEQRRQASSAAPDPTYLDLAIEYGSRLILIDASTDAVALRRAHPDPRVIVLPASARAWLRRDEQNPSGPATMTGNITPLVTELIVPLGDRPVVSAIPVSPYRQTGPPRYAIALHVGRHHEPWIDRIAAIDSSPPPR